MKLMIPKSEAPAFALADAQIQEGDPAANTSYATTPPPTTATTTGTDTIDSASQASPETSASSNTQTSLETPVPTLSDPDAVPLTPSGEEKVWVTKYGLKAFLPLAKKLSLQPL